MKYIEIEMNINTIFGYQSILFKVFGSYMYIVLEIKVRTHTKIYN